MRHIIYGGNISLGKYIKSNSVMEKIPQIKEKLVFSWTHVRFLCFFPPVFSEFNLLGNCRGLSFLYLDSISSVF